MRSHTLTLVLALCLAGASTISGQISGIEACNGDESADSNSQFAVATIKPVDAQHSLPRGIFGYPGGKVVIGNSSLRELIQYAFGLEAFQVTARVGWISNERFDLVALPSDDSPVRLLAPSSPKAPLDPRQLEMLRHLLCTRFKLSLRLSTTTESVLTLRRERASAELKPSKQGDTAPYVVISTFSDGIGNGALRGERATMSLLAARIGHYLQVQVTDKTGLTGIYDFDVSAPELADTNPNDAVLLGLKHLGLELKRQRSLVSKIVILNASHPSAA